MGGRLLGIGWLGVFGVSGFRRRGRGAGVLLGGGRLLGVGWLGFWRFEV